MLLDTAPTSRNGQARPFPQSKAEPSRFWALYPSNTRSSGHPVRPRPAQCSHLQLNSNWQQLWWCHFQTSPIHRRLTTEACSVPPAPLSSTEPRDCFGGIQAIGDASVNPPKSHLSRRSWRGRLRLLVPVSAGIVPLRGPPPDAVRGSAASWHPLARLRPNVAHNAQTAEPCSSWGSLGLVSCC